MSLSDRKNEEKKRFPLFSKLAIKKNEPEPEDSGPKDMYAQISQVEPQPEPVPVPEEAPEEEIPNPEEDIQPEQTKPLADDVDIDDDSQGSSPSPEPPVPSVPDSDESEDNNEESDDDEEYSDEDEESTLRKKKVMLYCLIGILILLVLMMLGYTHFSRKQAYQEASSRVVTTFPQIPDGTDNETITASNLSNYTRSVVDIYDAAQKDDENLSMIPDTMQTRKKRAAKEASAYEASVNRLATLFESTESDEEILVEPASPKEEAIDRLLLEQGYDVEEYHRSGKLVKIKEKEKPKESTQKKKKSSSSPSSTGTKKAPEQKAEPKQEIQSQPSEPSPQQETPKEEQSAAPKAAVRRSDAVSSLRSSSGGVQSLKSANESNMYVNEEEHPIRVMFVREEKLVSGQRVSLRLLEDMVVDGVLIPKNTHISASCSIGDRLNVKVSSLEINGRILRMNYVAYDTDGAEGIYCAQSQANKNIKEGTNDALSQTSSLLQTNVGTITSRAVQTGASIIRSRTGETSVTVTSGYIFFLMAGKN